MEKKNMPTEKTMDRMELTPKRAEVNKNNVRK